MENPVHSMANLFSQLGLASSNDAMTLFVRLHTLAPSMPLEQAPFWSASQSEFLREARADDSDWSELVDQLDSMLHQPTWH